MSDMTFRTRSFTATAPASFAVSAQPSIASLVHDVEVAEESKRRRQARAAERRRDRIVNFSLIGAFAVFGTTTVWLVQLVLLAA